MKKVLNVKSAFWLVISLLSFAYYIIEGFVVGFGFSLLWVWALLGTVSLILYFVIKRFGRIPLPKWLFSLLTVVIAILFAFFCFLECLVISKMDAKGEDNLDYIVVLGAKVRENGVPAKPLYRRIEAAESYLKANKNTIAILSGGKGHDEPMSEAMCMYLYLTERGIDKDRLILEDKSTDTNENIRFSMEHIENDATIGIITSNFHVYRASKIAESIYQKDVSPIAAKYNDPLLLHYMVREAAGIIADTLEGNMTFAK